MSSIKNTAFRLQKFRQLWGVETPLKEIIPYFKSLNNGGKYTGIEAGLMWIPQEEKSVFIDLLVENKLQWIPMIFTGEFNDNKISVDDHILSFEKQIEETISYSDKILPRLINSHSGMDSWSMEQSLEFFGRAIEIEKKFGIPIGHETHRSRILYNPWTTRDILLKIGKDLKLTCDFSHWVVVAERCFTNSNELEIIELAAKHALHVHARIGFPQGPQVPQPNHSDYSVEREAHDLYWSMVWKSQFERGFSESTLTPEYGPFPYAHTFDGKPLYDVSQVTEAEADRLAEKFSKQFN